MVPAPICFSCDYILKKSGKKILCKAYPKGVPQDMYEASSHNKVRKDQVGKFVFEFKKGK